MIPSSTTSTIIVKFLSVGCVIITRRGCNNNGALVVLCLVEVCIDMMLEVCNNNQSYTAARDCQQYGNSSLSLAERGSVNSGSSILLVETYHPAVVR